MANREPPTSAAALLPSAAVNRERPSTWGDDPSLDMAVLRQAGLDDMSILSVMDRAIVQRVPVGAIALAEGRVDASRYADALAHVLAIPRFDGRLAPRRDIDPGGVDWSSNGARIIVAGSCPADSIARLRPAALCIATASELMRAREGLGSRRALRRAVVHLRHHRPEFSAATRLARWQRAVAVTLPGIIGGGLLVEPHLTAAVLLGLVSLPFFAVVAVRLVGVVAVLRPLARPPPPPLADADLPTYAVLVPLYGEAALIPDIVRAPQRLDYPAAKLDLVLVLESVDAATCAAAARAAKPANLRILIVPDGQPRTKPRALAYALHFVTADLVVVYDAEDRPEADQLRLAASALAAGPPNLACVQARLNLYNPADSWFTRQFTIEYSALFDAILPALDRLGFPIPLGGTSNHFPRRILEAVGGWDPYNVTEDADLGLRLARLGYVTQILLSTTFEEAPITLRQWLPQRTRWLKGWVQTTLVHTRSPSRLLADLGLWRVLGLAIVLWGLLLSALVHPIPYLLLALSTAGLIPSPLPDPAAPLSAWLAFGSLALGYVSAMLVGWLAVRRRHPTLAGSVSTMPITWLLVSFAAYRALWQYVRAPFLWEKTTHAWRRARPQFRHGPDAATFGDSKGSQHP